jgi:hypothetical protein
MPPTLTAENLVRRIAAHCAHVNEPGAVGIRPEPAAAIVRRQGGQTRRAPGRADAAGGGTAEVGASGVEFFRKRRRLAAGDSFGMCQERPTVALSANGSLDPKATFITLPVNGWGVCESDN